MRFLAFAFLTACVVTIPEAPKTLPVGRIVTYWAEQAVGGNEAVEAGCALWWPLVRCQALPREQADIWFVESDFDRTWVTGEAHRGVIYLAPDLLKEYWPVRIAHELGHEMGAEHVPLYCPALPGNPCGRAIMNPILSDVPQATAADVVALFQGRQQI